MIPDPTPPNPRYASREGVPYLEPSVDPSGDPTYTPDPADVELVRVAIRSAVPPVRDGYVDGTDLDYAEARAVLAALAADGRLLPADAETRTEWGVGEYDEGVIPTPDREQADAAAAYDPALTVVCRRVGPWLPVPTDSEES